MLIDIISSASEECLLFFLREKLNPCIDPYRKFSQTIYQIVQNYLSFLIDFFGVFSASVENVGVEWSFWVQVECSFEIIVFIRLQINSHELLVSF